MHLVPIKYKKCLNIIFWLPPRVKTINPRDTKLIILIQGLMVFLNMQSVSIEPEQLKRQKFTITYINTI